MSSIFIYHKNCADGFGAAWTYKQVDPDAEFIPAHHGDTPPDVTDRDVVIADYSYDRETLLAMKEKAKSLIVLDHHISAKEALEGLDFCIFDMKRSGAGLTWDHFFPDKERHWLIDYIEDRDLWNHKLLHTHEVIAALDSYPKTFESWDNLADMPFDELVCEGISILRYKTQLVSHLVKNNHSTIILDGYEVPCINTPILQSEVGHALVKSGKHPFSVTYFDTAKRRIFSLRSTDEGMDVSVIAKVYGGGGHRCASGFSILQEEVGEIL